ncbi:MAG: hypothetical protein AB8I08_05770 [Sandaracinaceae bacterium]
MRCETSTHTRAIAVEGTHWVIRCERNAEADGIRASEAPCERVVASLRRR